VLVLRGRGCPDAAFWGRFWDWVKGAERSICAALVGIWSEWKMAACNWEGARFEIETGWSPVVAGIKCWC